MHSPDLYLPRRTPFGLARVNWSDSLADGLLGAWTLRPGFNQNAATGQLSGPLGTNQSWTPSQFGMGLFTNGSSTVMALHHGKLNAAAGSVSFWCSWGTAPAASTQPRIADDQNTGDGIEIYFDAYVSSKLHFGLVQGNGASRPGIYENSAISANQLTHYVGTWRWTGTTYSFQIYKNGQTDASGSSGTTELTSPDTQTVLLGWDTGSSGYLYDFRVWNRVLAASEASTLYVDPNRMFREAPQNQAWFFMFSPSGGGTTPSATDSATLTDTANRIGVSGPADSTSLAEQVANALGTADSAALVESIKLALSATESAQLGEAMALALAHQDTATLQELVSVALAIADAASLSESASVTQNGGSTPSSSDSATLAESGAIAAPTSTSDIGQLAEAAAIKLGATDVASMTEQIGLGLIAADSAALTEQLHMAVASATSAATSLGELQNVVASILAAAETAGLTDTARVSQNGVSSTALKILTLPTRSLAFTLPARAFAFTLPKP